MLTNLNNQEFTKAAFSVGSKRHTDEIITVMSLISFLACIYEIINNVKREKPYWPLFQVLNGA